MPTYSDNPQGSLIGAGPDFAWSLAGWNKFVDNVNVKAQRQVYQLATTTPPTTINNTTAGTWATIQSWSMVNQNLLSHFTFAATLSRNTSVANWARFGLFRNNVLIFDGVEYLNQAATFYPQVSFSWIVNVGNGSGTDNFDFKWMVTSAATAITIGMPSGYRIAHYQV